jgi:predicted N-acetyltransferase YhbS
MGEAINPCSMQRDPDEDLHRGAYHMFTIREITEPDVPWIVDVIQAAFEEYRGRLDPPSSAHHKTADIVRRELADGGAFVACDTQAIVGCVFYHLYPDHLYLDRLAVLPSFRHQGIARALIQAVETRARQAGLGEVRLSVRLMLESNLAYYERLGYRFLSYGTHAGYTTPTSVTLCKQVELTWSALSTAVGCRTHRGDQGA